MKTHFVHPNDLKPFTRSDGKTFPPDPHTRCGRPVKASLGRTGYRFEQKQFTTEQHKVTCERCQ